MPILQIVVIIIVIGVLLWLANSYIPMDPKVKSILNAVVIILLVVWLLSLFFDFGSLGSVRVGRH
jgi:hypothetical protein